MQPLLVEFMIFHNIWISSILLLIFACCNLAPVRAQEGVGANPQVISKSSDGKFILRRAKAEAGEHGEARKNLEICADSGKILYAWASGLGSTTMLWSPDSRYLAVNDMPGDRGDLVHVFALDPVKNAVSVIREPDGKKLFHEQETRHGSFLSTLDRATLRAVEWREGRLWCLMTGSFHPKRQPRVHVPFHHLWVFDVHGGGSAVLQEEWTLTDPREHPSRDP